LTHLHFSSWHFLDLRDEALRLWLKLLLLDDLGLLVRVYYFGVNDGHTLWSAPIDRLGDKVLLLVALVVNVDLTDPAGDIK
jgi:hypothetical protein